MRYAVFILALLGSVALAKETISLAECSGCHLQERLNLKGHFPTGFGRWENAQCYGCHAEIHDVVKNFIKKGQDRRYTALPISDQRILNMESNPLPYLDSPLVPWLHGKSIKVDQTSLIDFLKRPHGKCFSDGKCLAPNMMAFPNIINLDSLDYMIPEIRDENTGDPNLGLEVFERKCASCHKYSDLSGYDGVALSLFSSKWLTSYANNSDISLNGRKMPVVPISLLEGRNLYSYFRALRLERETAIDQLVSRTLKNVKNLNNLNSQSKCIA